MPLQIIHEALAEVEGLGKWTFDAHQYVVGLWTASTKFSSPNDSMITSWG